LFPSSGDQTKNILRPEWPGVVLAALHTELPENAFYYLDPDRISVRLLSFFRMLNRQNGSRLLMICTVKSKSLRYVALRSDNSPPKPVATFHTETVNGANIPYHRIQDHYSHIVFAAGAVTNELPRHYFSLTRAVGWLNRSAVDDW
jgi:hypothetical protein